MTVSIDIDLDAMDAIQEVATLRVALESLEDDLDLDLDLDGDLDKQLSNLSDTLEDLSDAFDGVLDDESITRLENLEFDDIRVAGRRSGDSSGNTGSDSGDYVPSARQYFDGGPFEDNTNDPSPLRQALQKFHNNVDGLGDAFELGETRLDTTGSGSSGNRGRFSQFKMLMGDSGTNLNADFRRSLSVSSIIPDGDGGGREGLLSRAANFAGGPLMELSDVFGDMKKDFKRAIPSMSTWLNLIGAAIPALGAMAVQAIGVAAAMGSVAVAGAAMIGLGLIGHGDSMAESFQNAKLEIQDLKKDLFETFEPTADLFGGIQTEFFDFIPGQLDRVARSMRGLTAFKDDAFGMFRGLTEFIAEMFGVMTSNSGIISELTTRFSKLLGSSLIDLFEMLIHTGYRNQEMLVKLGFILREVGIALYELFKMVGRALVMLTPMFTLFKWIAGILNNSLVSGMIAIVAVGYVLTSVFSLIIGSLSMMATLLGTGLIPLFSGLFTAMSTWLFQTLTQTMANYGLAASIANVAAALGTLLAMSGIGLLVAGAGLTLGSAMGITGGSSGRGSGFGGSGGSGSGPRGVTNNYYEGDNVNVDMSGGGGDTSTLEQFKDMRSKEDTRGLSVNDAYTGG